MIRQIDTRKGPIEIRELQTMVEMQAAEEIQIKVWGAGISPHPKELLIPVQHEGGLLAGAFTNDQEMVGLVFSFPTGDPTIMHSQMLATLESWRGCGIGTQLKWFQRDWCLNRGIKTVRWTVDPLRAANAEVNIRHLGGIATTYYCDYYGKMQGIDAGSPTDRLLLDWHLDSERVRARSIETPKDDGFPNSAPVLFFEGVKPIRADLSLTESHILVRLPEHFIQMSQTDPQLTLSWRMLTRKVFMHYFNSGYVLTEYTRFGPSPAYLLEKRI